MVKSPLMVKSSINGKDYQLMINEYQLMVKSFN